MISTQVATCAYALAEDEELVDHYGRISNLFRRWSFLIATVALVGALNVYQVAHQDRSVWKRMDPVLQLEVRFLVLLYALALALTLVMSTVEVSLSNDFNDDDFRWEDKFGASGLTSLKTWRGCCWARFFFTAIGWLISCRRQDYVAQQLHRAKRETDALRNAVRNASSRILAQAASRDLEDTLHPRAAAPPAPSAGVPLKDAAAPKAPKHPTPASPVATPPKGDADLV